MAMYKGGCLTAYCQQCTLRQALSRPSVCLPGAVIAGFVEAHILLYASYPSFCLTLHAETAVTLSKCMVSTFAFLSCRVIHTCNPVLLERFLDQSAGVDERDRHHATLKSARLAAELGTSTVIVNGSRPNVLLRVRVLVW